LTVFIGSYAANNKLAMLNKIYNCLSAAITQTKLSQRQKAAYNAGINNAYTLLIAYVVYCINTVYQGTTEGKSDKNIIYNTSLTAHYNTTTNHKTNPA